eukprot:4061717-Amphidinium_carterae.1
MAARQWRISLQGALACSLVPTSTLRNHKRDVSFAALVELTRACQIERKNSAYTGKVHAVARNSTSGYLRQALQCMQELALVRWYAPEYPRLRDQGLQARHSYAV